MLINMPSIKFQLFLTLVIVVTFFGGAETLECYVCNQQEGNVEKCLATIRTCNYTEDTCLTEVRWGSTPYWSQGAEKQYYVTKTCATRNYCESRREQFVHECHRIWYEDWKCAECCQGDRCNYYAFMGAGSLGFNWISTITGVFIAILVQRLA